MIELWRPFLLNLTFPSALLCSALLCSVENIIVNADQINAVSHQLFPMLFYYLADFIFIDSRLSNGFMILRDN